MTDTGFTDAAYDMAFDLLISAQGAMPSFTLYLLAQAVDLPTDPQAARATLKVRWPALTDAEREAAFRVAVNVLRRAQRECGERATLLEGLSSSSGSA